MIKADIKVPKITTEMKPALQRWLARSTYIVRWTAVQKAPYKTGTLRRSIVEKVSWLVGKVWTNLVYARIHEYWGTIRPKKARRLVFRKNWKLIFAKQVRIPKRPYMQPALKENQKKIHDIFAQEIEKFISKDI